MSYLILFFHEFFFIGLIIFCLCSDDKSWIYYTALILAFILFFTGSMYSMYELHVANEVFVETGEKKLASIAFFIPFVIRGGTWLLLGLIFSLEEGPSSIDHC